MIEPQIRMPEDSEKKPRGGKRPGAGRTPAVAEHRREFAIWLEASGLTKEQFAGNVGIKLPTLYGYLNGSGSPGLRTAVKIERATGGLFPPDYWLPKNTAKS